MAKMDAEMAARAEAAQKLRDEKEALAKKLRAMEGKILKVCGWVGWGCGVWGWFGGGVAWGRSCCR